MVSYPYGVDENGTIRHVLSASRGQLYLCIGCDSPLIPKQGHQVSWHFAHERGGDCSNSETALHRTGAELIKAGFEDAQVEKRPYIAALTCRHCGSDKSCLELTEGAELAVREFYVSSKLRPDVSFIRETELIACAEVVVTSAPSTQALVEYRNLGIPAFIVRPTWEDVWKLKEAVRTTEALNFSANCEWCATRNQRELAALLARLARGKMIRRAAARTRWTRNRYRGRR